MKKKIVIGSIFAALILLFMPVILNIQAEPALVNKEPDVTSTEKPLRRPPTLLCRFLLRQINKCIENAENAENFIEYLKWDIRAGIIAIPYAIICFEFSATTSNADGCSLCPNN